MDLVPEIKKLQLRITANFSEYKESLLFCGFFCSRLFSTGHLASSVSFYFSLWLWFTTLPAQYAILHPIPTGLWKGWWETLCSISLALYHQSLHCCPGIVSSLISFIICESTLCLWLGGREHFFFQSPSFFLPYQPSHYFSVADYMKSGCLTSYMLLTTGTDHSSWP